MTGDIQGASAEADRAAQASPQAPTGLGRSVSIPSAVTLSATEEETLTAWDECEEGYGFGFRLVAENCKTPKPAIRRSVRALARKGLLEYAQSLCSEDGKMGAGYTITKAGLAYLSDVEERKWNAFDARMRADHASWIAARSGETPQEVRPEGQEPGPEGETPENNQEQGQ